MAKQYFLAKSDPSEYSLSDLERDGKTAWTGVKNAQAQMAIKKMKTGDLVLIYHSQGEAAVVGWAFADSEPRPDAENPKLAVIDFRYGGRIATPLTLTEVKTSGLFASFLLVRNSRLSTMEVPGEFIQWLKKQRKDFRP